MLLKVPLHTIRHSMRRGSFITSLKRTTMLRGASRVLSSATAPPPRARGGRFAGVAALGLVGAGAYLAAPEAKIKLAEGQQIEDVDALLIGGGIMSASVGLMLKLMHPSWKIRIVERLDRVGAESSNEWHNAGTGHAALCEPNYTPMNSATGEVDISKAVAVNQKFLISLQWWSWLVEKGVLPDGAFVQPAPHITFVHGDENVDWLRKRVEKLRKLPSFAPTEYSEDYDKIQSWVGLLCSGRPREGGAPIACSRHPDGTEVNYGLLTRYLMQSFSELGGEIQLLSTAVALEQQPDKRWLVAVRKTDLARTDSVVRAKLVFAGAGGGALRILQKAQLPEVRGYAGMPISGKFLVCQEPRIIEQNTNKVYGRAALGAPPMSVPHLDWRTIYGKDCIFFGPFAGFSPTVFKNGGSVLDWLATLNLSNLLPLAAMGLQNLDLVRFLVSEIFASKETQLRTLREFVPDARPDEWTMVWAGQRIQIVKPDDQLYGKLQFGTEVVASKDKTIVGLLGASPGASVSPHIAIQVLEHFECATEHREHWHTSLATMIPTYGRDVNAEPGLYAKVMGRARAVLLEGKSSGFRAAKGNIMRIFDRLDVDSDGTISLKELRKHLRAQGVDSKTIEALVCKLDTDRSGDISRDEFTAGFSAFVTGQLNSAHDSAVHGQK